MTEKTSKAGGRKKQVFEKVIALAQKYPIIGVVDLTNLPTPPLQRMREQLRDKVDLYMAKKRVIQKALKQIKEKPGIEDLNKYLEKAQPALLFTSDNPFTLFKTLKKNKSKAPAKGGQTAPKDIIVPAGPTSFAPGPIIGELGQFGIKAGVEGGKITIKADTAVCKEGEQISEKLASILGRLGIEPMEIGLDLKAVYEKGTIYPKKILDIDEEQFMKNMMTAATEAFNLAIDTSYPCKETTEHLIQKAFKEAKAVAKEGNIISDATAEEMLEQAEKEMLALKNTAKIEIPEKKQETAKKTEQTPKEAKKEEQETKQETEKPKKTEQQPTENNKEEKQTQEKTKETEKQEKKTEQKKETQSKSHPKQGNVTQEQAGDLLNQLQKEGTLRKEE